jgi:hypothetical protein
MEVKPLAPLEHLLDRLVALLTTQMAKELEDFRYDAQTQARISELAKKANEGTLTSGARAIFAICRGWRLNWDHDGSSPEVSS